VTQAGTHRYGWLCAALLRVVSVGVVAVASGDGANSMQDGILLPPLRMAENVGRERQGDALVEALHAPREPGETALLPVKGSDRRGHVRFILLECPTVDEPF
jgi:hypothetical protein